MLGRGCLGWKGWRTGLLGAGMLTFIHSFRSISLSACSGEGRDDAQTENFISFSLWIEVCLSPINLTCDPRCLGQHNGRSLTISSSSSAAAAFKRQDSSHFCEDVRERSVSRRELGVTSPAVFGWSFSPCC